MSVVFKYVIPIGVSLALHGVVFYVLVGSWESPQKKPMVVPPKYVEAKLVQLKDTSKKKASAKKRPKVVDLTAKKREQERRKKEAEKKRRKAAEAKRKREAQLKKEREEKARKEKQRKEKEEARKREEQRKQEELRRQQEFEEALMEEEGLLLDEQLAEDAQSYTAKIQERVQSNWSRPPSARNGMTCLLDIQLVPTGRIVSVTVIEGSGNAAFDRSAVQAVKKVEVFPEVKEMSPEVFERYYRRFRFLFNPQDLRL